MNSINWEAIPREQYIIASLIFLCLLFLFSFFRSRTRLHKIKKLHIADLIDLEEAGKREKWFRIFTESIPQVFWIQNQHQTLYISPHFEELTGHPEGLLRRGMSDFLKLAHPEESECVQQAHILFWKDPSKTLDLNFRIRKSGNQWIWIRERIFHYRHVNGEHFHIGLLEDITEKQAFIEHIRENRILLDNILDSSDEGIFGMDRDFKLIHWNKEMESITGKKQKEVMDGQSIFFHFPHLLENGLAEVMKKTMENQLSEPETYPYHLSNNRKGFTRDKYLPLINAHGEITGVIGFIKDVTEEIARETILEKTQEQFALTLQAVRDGIWDWNLRADTLIFSDHWFALLGYSPDELASSMQTLHQLLVDPNDQETLAATKKRLLAGETIDIELCMKHKSGEFRWMLIRGKAIESDSEGTPVRAIGTQTDITQRKHYELDLVLAKEKAEESDRLKSSFLANMSHEIRTPLNAIIGFTDLLLTDQIRAEERESFRLQIRQNSDKLLQLFSDIIDLSQIESGHSRVQNQEVNLLEMLKSTLQKVHKSLSSDLIGEVKVKIQVPPENKTCSLQTDPEMLEKILFNLIQNAFIYTPKGQINIGFFPPDQNRIKVFVRDTGIGIRQEDQEKIFNQFEQLDQGLTRSHGGTGLGLTLAHRLSQLIHAELSLESEPGKGSCFYVSLPCQTPSDTL